MQLAAILCLRGMCFYNLQRGRSWRLQAVRTTEAVLTTLQQQNEALQRDVDRFQQRDRLLKEVSAYAVLPPIQG